MTKRAAVIIGVGKTGGLVQLNSPVPGAKQVADWLEGEGFKVQCLTDETGPVTAEEVRKAIKKFVTLPPQFHLLVVYFSGHGYWQTRSDVWLFSEAPTNPDDAINLDGAIDLARYSGIPNVVFISDACRSLPDTRSGAYVRGIDAFPNYDQINTKSKVDWFKATSEARAAYEDKINGVTQSIMTYVLKQAYVEPAPHMVREILEGGKKIQVVPNRKLDEDFFQRKVNAVLNPKYTQRIEVNVPSGDDIYISRVLGPLRSMKPEMPEGPEPVGPTGGLTQKTVGFDASQAVSSALTVRGLGVGRSNARDLLRVSKSETEAALSRRLPFGPVDHFESECGFTVMGVRVKKAVTTKKGRAVRVELLDKGDGKASAAVIRLWNVEPAMSLAIQLEDGKCSILPGLRGYIGHVIFDDEGMANVSYVPSSNNQSRWFWYEQRKEEIDRLRALVSLAVDHENFRIRSEREAESLAATIRVEKAVDPTLGLYAAHAFSQAGKEEKVLSVLRYMREDLGADLFDVRVLASRMLRDEKQHIPQVPFVPMLTQTWNLLRPRGLDLPPLLEEARPYLCNSLWTTFHPRAADRIMEAIKEGELP